jgi:AcrR family transcriptional regulator
MSLPSATPGATGSTPDRILSALVDVILDGGLPAFSVQEVADRAGVSHRTVYRHFPTRESLLEALTYDVGRRMDARGGVSKPSSLDAVPRAALINFALFSRDARAVEAGVRFGVGAAIEIADRRQRADMFRDLAAASLPALSPEDSAMAGAVIRQVASSRTWLGFREAGLDDGAAGRAVAWATRVLIDALHGGRTPGAEPLPAPVPRDGGPEGEP